VTRDYNLESPEHTASSQAGLQTPNQFNASRPARQPANPQATRQYFASPGQKNRAPFLSRNAAACPASQRLLNSGFLISAIDRYPQLTNILNRRSLLNFAIAADRSDRFLNSDKQTNFPAFNPKTFKLLKLKTT
jgi:hypothetical protein